MVFAAADVQKKFNVCQMQWEFDNAFIKVTKSPTN